MQFIKVGVADVSYGPAGSLRGLTTSSFAVCSFAVLIIFCALTVAWMTCGPSLVIATKPGILFRNIRGTKPDTVESLRLAVLRRSFEKRMKATRHLKQATEIQIVYLFAKF